MDIANPGTSLFLYNQKMFDSGKSRILETKFYGQEGALATIWSVYFQPLFDRGALVKGMALQNVLLHFSLLDEAKISLLVTVYANCFQ